MSDPWSKLSHARLCVRPVGTTSDEQKEYLDQEISNLESALARAKQLRNQENSFATLPEEVLLHIILYRRDISSYEPRPDRPERAKGAYWHKAELQYQPWTNIGAVCRRFRHIMSTCPQLNSNVSDMILPPRIIERILPRSSRHALTVTLSHRVSGRHHAAPGVLRYIKQNRSRVQSMTLHEVHTQDELDVQLIGRLKLFPNLRHLAIHDYRPWPSPMSLPPALFVVPADLTGRPMSDWRPPPALKSLHITMKPFPWDSAIYSHLTHLTLSKLELRVTAMQTLWSNLTRGACLESITFDDIDIEFGITLEEEEIEEYEEEGLEEEEIVVRLEQKLLMDVVQRLEPAPATLKTWNVILSTDESLLAFMRPSMSIAYHVRITEPWHWESELVQFLAKHCPEPNSDRVTDGAEQVSQVVAVRFSVQPYLDSKRRKILQATTSFFRHRDPRAPFLTFQFVVDGETNGLSAYVLGDFDGYNVEKEEPYLDDVRELSLESVSTYSPDRWASVLELFPSLTTLEVSEDLLSNVIPAIERVNAASDSDLPLAIRRLHIRPSEKYGYTSSAYSVNLLLDWLSRQKERGLPLREVNVPPILGRQMDEHYDWEESADDTGGNSGGWRSLIEELQ
ncbi:unnamed protein product [Peniophora sp. CBMAI 1063]|nr:unnamed protein product [Peniophora sp. CBMAI 1063]